MENSKQQALERLKQANNVLVTVSNNPTVDQLSALIGFTLFLNKQGKHATAVFSGKVPSTIDFLKPDKTVEKNTDSLRDFIISLDKSKADKLRYKVEDQHVKVFITPYRTSITEADLEFSQGDFNVDAVVALGVKEQKDLDQAITAHGRILHDATVISVSTGTQSTLGTINIIDDHASSLCEIMANLSETMQPNTLDNQMATAYLTGIVAETARFSNEKTTSGTMNVSAKLMAAGANQQLVATELQKPEPQASVQQFDAPIAAAEVVNDGTLEIGHVDTPADEGDSVVDQIEIDEHGAFSLPETVQPEPPKEVDTPTPGTRNARMTEAPTHGGTLTANTEEEGLSPSIDPLAQRPTGTLLSHDGPATAGSAEDADQPTELPQPESYVSASPTHLTIQPLPPAPVPTPPQPEPVAVPLPEPVQPEVPAERGDATLADIERNIGSPHALEPAAAPEAEASPPADANKDGEVDLDEARNAVLQAISESGTEPLPVPAAMGSQPLDLNVQQIPDYPLITTPDLSLPTGLIPEDVFPVDNTASFVENPTAPPPVPPPMMPPTQVFEDPSSALPTIPGSGLPPVAPQDQNNPFGLPPA